MLYEDPVEGKARITENLILIPFSLVEGKVCGIIEISKLNEDFEIDGEYFCILLKMFSKLLIKNLNSIDILKKQLRYYFISKNF